MIMPLYNGPKLCGTCATCYAHVPTEAVQTEPDSAEDELLRAQSLSKCLEMVPETVEAPEAPKGLGGAQLLSLPSPLPGPFPSLHPIKSLSPAT